MSKTQRIAVSIAASMEACRAIVAAFADGRLIPLPRNGTKPQDMRYAPHFRLGMPFDTPGAAYTVGHISETLASQGVNTFIYNGKGKFTSSRYIVLAMQILTGIEEGWVDEAFLIENLRTGKFKISQLRSELKARREAHEAPRRARGLGRRTVGSSKKVIWSEVRST